MSLLHLANNLLGLISAATAIYAAGRIFYVAATAPTQVERERANRRADEARRLGVE